MKEIWIIVVIILITGCRVEIKEQCKPCPPSYETIKYNYSCDLTKYGICIQDCYEKGNKNYEMCMELTRETIGTGLNKLEYCEEMTINRANSCVERCE